MSTLTPFDISDQYPLFDHLFVYKRSAYYKDQIFRIGTMNLPGKAPRECYYTSKVPAAGSTEVQHSFVFGTPDHSHAILSPLVAAVISGDPMMLEIPQMTPDHPYWLYLFANPATRVLSSFDTYFFQHHEDRTWNFPEGTTLPDVVDYITLYALMCSLPSSIRDDHAAYVLRMKTLRRVLAWTINALSPFSREFVHLRILSAFIHDGCKSSFDWEEAIRAFWDSAQGDEDLLLFCHRYYPSRVHTDYDPSYDTQNDASVIGSGTRLHRLATIQDYAGFSMANRGIVVDPAGADPDMLQLWIMSHNRFVIYRAPDTNVSFDYEASEIIFHGDAAYVGDAFLTDFSDPEYHYYLAIDSASVTALPFDHIFYLGSGYQPTRYELSTHMITPDRESGPMLVCVTCTSPLDAMGEARFTRGEFFGVTPGVCQVIFGNHVGHVCEYDDRVFTVAPTRVPRSIYAYIEYRCAASDPPPRHDGGTFWCIECQTFSPLMGNLTSLQTRQVMAVHTGHSLIFPERLGVYRASVGGNWPSTRSSSLARPGAQGPVYDLTVAQAARSPSSHFSSRLYSQDPMAIVYAVAASYAYDRETRENLSRVSRSMLRVFLEEAAPLEIDVV